MIIDFIFLHVKNDTAYERKHAKQNRKHTKVETTEPIHSQARFLLILSQKKRSNSRLSSFRRRKRDTDLDRAKIRILVRGIEVQVNIGKQK